MMPTLTRLTSTRMAGGCCSCATQNFAQNKVKKDRNACAAKRKWIRCESSVNPAIEVKAVRILPGITEAEMEMFVENFRVDFVEPGFCFCRIGFVRSESEERGSSRGLVAVL